MDIKVLWTFWLMWITLLWIFLWKFLCAHIFSLLLGYVPKCRIAGSYGNFFFFLLFRAAPTEYGGSQTRGLIGATAAGLCKAGSKPSPWPTAHGNARSLTHWEGPGIEPESSWILVGFVSAEPQGELHMVTKMLTFLRNCQTTFQIDWHHFTV